MPPLLLDSTHYISSSDYVHMYHKCNYNDRTCEKNTSGAVLLLDNYIIHNLVTNVSSHFANAFLLTVYHTLWFQKDTLVLHCFWTAHISTND